MKDVPDFYKRLFELQDRLQSSIDEKVHPDSEVGKRRTLQMARRMLLNYAGEIEAYLNRPMPKPPEGDRYLREKRSEIQGPYPLRPIAGKRDLKRSLGL